VKVTEAEFVLSAPRISDMPNDRIPEIAIVGRSNVGKSSLINAMLNRKNLARTSSTPGKTQTINFFRINRKFYLVDVPGLGYAKAPKKQRRAWERLIEDYIMEREQLETVIHLVDSRHKPTEIDWAITQVVRESGRSYLVALTKIDKLNQKERSKVRSRMEEALVKAGLEAPIIETSATKGTGIVKLWKWVDELVIGH